MVTAHFQRLIGPHSRRTCGYVWMWFLCARVWFVCQCLFAFVIAHGTKLLNYEWLTYISKQRKFGLRSTERGRLNDIVFQPMSSGLFFHDEMGSFPWHPNQRKLSMLDMSLFQNTLWLLTCLQSDSQQKVPGTMFTLKGRTNIRYDYFKSNMCRRHQDFHFYITGKNND